MIGQVIDDATDCACATIVIPDQHAFIFKRCWPLYEMWTTVVGKGPEALQFTCPGGEGMQGGLRGPTTMEINGILNIHRGPVLLKSFPQVLLASHT